MLMFRTLLTPPLFLLAAISLDLHAQRPSFRDVARRALASRSELVGLVDSLEATLPALDPKARSLAMAAIASERQRLAEGDFRPGDRILLRVASESVRTDTITVSGATTLAVSGVPDLPLRGVLRSELSGHLQEQLDRFVRNARVTALPLVSVGVLGSVARPGYYLIPSSTPITEALMAAGGPTSEADPSGIMLRHGGRDAWSRTEMVAAAQGQLSLASLGTVSGDVILVNRLPPPVDRTFFLAVSAIVLQGIVTIAALLAAGG
jgi:protein involved in polysaccharide export with SLBB domain